MQTKIAHPVLLCVAIAAVIFGWQYGTSAVYSQSVDGSVLTALTNELRLLRQALERSAAQKSQAEIELQALRLEQESAERFRQQLFGVQNMIAEAGRDAREHEETVKSYEKRLATENDQQQRKDLEHQIQMSRFRMEECKRRVEELVRREADIKAEQSAEKEKAEELKTTWRDPNAPKK